MISAFAHYCMKMAYWKPGKIYWQGKEKELQPGQFYTGRIKLSKETGISQQSIRSAIKFLTNVKFLTSESTNKGSIITILNYEYYQSGEDNQPADQPVSNQQPTSNQPATNQQVTTDEEVKKLRSKELKKDQKHAPRPKPPLMPLPECVAIYRDVFHYSLNPTSRAEVESVIGCNGNLSLWREILTGWALRGGNPKNLRGMLECFKAGKIEDKFKEKSKTVLLKNMPELSECKKKIIRFINGSYGCEIECGFRWSENCLQFQAVEEIKKEKGI
jgi:hypothetical protein